MRQSTSFAGSVWPPKRKFVAIAIAVLVSTGAFTGATDASAGSVTVGRQDLSISSGTTSCLGSSFCWWAGIYNDALSTPGSHLTLPADGTITSWRVRGSVSGLGTINLHVVRPLGGGSYLGVADSNAATDLTAGPNATNLPALAGDTLSITLSTQGDSFSAAIVDFVNAPSGSHHGMGILSSGSTTTLSGPSTTGEELLYNATAELLAPEPMSLSSASGPIGGGNTVTITGNHMAVATGVMFGAQPAQIVSGDNAQVTVLAPAATTDLSVPVTVTTAGGTSAPSAATTYTYDDAKRPKITRLKISPSAFETANIGGPIASRVGAKVSFKLSEPAVVTFTVKGVSAKRKFTIQGKQGTNRFTFTGRPGRKALKPGKHTLVAKAVDMLGNKSRKAATRGFKIKR